MLEKQTPFVKLMNIKDGKEHNGIYCFVKELLVEEMGWFWDTDPSTSDPSTLRGHVWASTEGERVL